MPPAFILSQDQTLHDSFLGITNHLMSFKKSLFFKRIFVLAQIFLTQTLLNIIVFPDYHHTKNTNILSIQSASLSFLNFIKKWDTKILTNLILCLLKSKICLHKKHAVKIVDKWLFVFLTVFFLGQTKG